jgi:hypothetical protein
VLDTSSNLNWESYKKISFRFFFIFLVAFIFINNNGAFFYNHLLVYYPTQLLYKFIPWFADHILHYTYDHTIFTNGSGDTTYDYLVVLVLCLTAVLGTIIWSVLDRKRPNYNQLYYWLIALVRFYLAFTLIMYGSIKVIQLQFPLPSLTRLLQPFGNASPMGLAWTFLGFSPGYNLFMGIIEIMAVLLLFRKTMVAGAIFALAASAHVMSMNYFFDVPVKILSTTLVAMCLFILAPYLITIGRFLLFNGTQQLRPLEAPVMKKRWQFITLRVFKYIFIIWTIALFSYSAYNSQYQYGKKAPRPALYGIYNVEQYILNGKEVPPLATDKNRWKQLIIEYNDFAKVKTMNDSALSMNVLYEAKKKSLQMRSLGADSSKYTFHYQFKNDSTMIVSGSRNQDSLQIVFRKYNLKNFRLTNRGFHWVNERPFNR